MQPPAKEHIVQGVRFAMGENRVVLAPVYIEAHCARYGRHRRGAGQGRVVLEDASHLAGRLCFLTWDDARLFSRIRTRPQGRTSALPRPRAALKSLVAKFANLWPKELVVHPPASANHPDAFFPVHLRLGDHRPGPPPRSLRLLPASTLVGLHRQLPCGRGSP